MQVVVVSDAGPLISLEKLIGGFDFSRKIFSEILVPEAVANEVSVEVGSWEAYTENHKISDFVKVEFITPHPEFIGSRLDRGEIEALTLARSRSLPLLIEERAGREVANKFRIPISGIIGQVVTAYKDGIINQDSALTFTIQLRMQSRISKPLFVGALQAICDGRLLTLLVKADNYASSLAHQLRPPLAENTITEIKELIIERQ